MVVPVAIVLEVGEAGAAAVLPVNHVVRFAAGGGLVTAAGILARLVPQRHQAAQMDGDIVGPPYIQRQRGSVQALTQQVPAQERGDPAGAGDDLEDLAQDLMLQVG